ncbi:MAG: hypothetical protein HFH68_01635 [Lachnospiraceae bacterium]|nr:hypothetical protein [Lachnospiraceae bacterium]
MEYGVKKLTVFGDGISDTGIKSEEKEDIDYTYDKPFKELFSNKVFLAPVLKNIVPEYKNLELEEIEKLITTNSIADVNPQVYNSEDFGKGRETVTHYDVLVSCALSEGKVICVGFYFDLEMQRESAPKYPVVKRGVYYCCRLVSRQIERLGEEAYNQIKPVYSVWIMINNIPEGLQNSVYTLELSGHSNKEKADITSLNREADLIHLSLVYLSEDFRSDEKQDNLISYLQSVFLHKVSNSQFNPYYEYSRKIQKEVDEVMSVMEMFETRGEVRGEARGEARGEVRGKIEILVEDGYTDEEIIERLTMAKNNPLTREDAEKSLASYYEKYNEA